MEMNGELYEKMTKTENLLKQIFKPIKLLHINVQTNADFRVKMVQTYVIVFLPQVQNLLKKWWAIKVFQTKMCVVTHHHICVDGQRHQLIIANREV